MKKKLLSFLKFNQWNYNSITPDLITFLVTGNSGILRCIADIRETDKLFVFISFSSIPCPQELREKMSGILNQINVKLLFGNFEIDIETGYIKFRTSNYFIEKKIDKEALPNIIFRNINVLDFSLNFLMKYMFGQINSEQLFESLFPNPIQILIKLFA